MKILFCTYETVRSSQYSRFISGFGRWEPPTKISSDVGIKFPILRSYYAGEFADALLMGKYLNENII